MSMYEPRKQTAASDSFKVFLLPFQLFVKE